jgi:hypothetical protein
VRTHDGLILDNIKENNAHIYDRNDVFIMDKSDIFVAYVFWLKNNMFYNKRIYKRIPDIIPSIGGVYQFITIISIYINSLYNHYIVLSDTEQLLHSSIHNEKHINNKKEKGEEKENMKNQKIKKLEKETKNTKNKNNLTQKVKNENPIRNLENIKVINNSQMSNVFVSIDKINDKMNTNIEINNPNNNINKIKDINFENKPTLRRRIIHFFDFLLYEISCCKKKKHYFKVYKDFRIKIISEEHLIRNHLNIYNLLRITERKRHYRRNSYQIEDLIKLV